jgi:hypothetical protein
LSQASEKIPYLNRDQQEQLLLLTLNIVTLEELAKQDKFRFAAGDLRRARAFAQRAYDAIKDRLDPHDLQKIAKVAEQSKLVIRAKTQPTKDQAVIDVTLLQDLTAYAIGNHCRGCERHDWKKCYLRALLMDTWCPPAQETKTDCQYRQ